MSFAQMLMSGPMLTCNSMSAPHKNPKAKSPEQVAKYVAQARVKREARYRAVFMSFPDRIANTSQICTKLGIDNSTIGKMMRRLCSEQPPVVQRLKPTRLKGCSRDVNVYQWIGD